MLRTTLACLLLSLPALAAAQQIPDPVLDGYISTLQSQVSFEVDGRKVQVAETASPLCPDAAGHRLATIRRPLLLGDPVIVFGTWSSKKQLATATAVCRVEASPPKELSGDAIIEKIEAGELAADGRVFQTDSSTTVAGDRHTLAEARPNDWLRYKAVLQPNGGYLLRSAVLYAPVVSPREQKLRTHSFVEFTPPDPSLNKEGTVRFLGTLPGGFAVKRVKLPTGPQLARVQQVGARLVPPWQRSLAASDPARDDFNFYVADGLKVKTCLSFASGDIFLPTDLATRLVDDPDLAAILATCVADILEKQAALLGSRALTASRAELAVNAASYVVPGVGLAAGVGELAYGGYTAEQAKRIREQSARVSLHVLEEAGFPVAAAPVAQEIAETKHLPLKRKPLPSERTAYLYKLLAEREQRQP